MILAEAMSWPDALVTIVGMLVFGAVLVAFFMFS